MKKSGILVIIVLCLAILTFVFSGIDSLRPNINSQKDFAIEKFNDSIEEGVFILDNFAYANIRLDVPTPCHEVMSSVIQKEKKITFELDIKQTADNCAQVITEKKALLAYGPLEPGEYILEVTAITENSEWPEGLIYERKTLSV